MAALFAAARSDDWDAAGCAGRPAYDNVAELPYWVIAKQLHNYLAGRARLASAHQRPTSLGRTRTCPTSTFSTRSRRSVCVWPGQGAHRAYLSRHLHSAVALYRCPSLFRLLRSSTYFNCQSFNTHLERRGLTSVKAFCSFMTFGPLSALLSSFATPCPPTT